MEEEYFVKYILDNKLLAQDVVDRALEVQKKRLATPIGEIALRLNMLTPEQIGTILAAQKTYEHKLFGEVAVKLGYLKDKDIDKLLSAQKRLRAPLIKIMTETNCASVKQLAQWYTEYINSLTIIKYSCAKCGISITKEEWEEGTKNCPECGSILVLKATKETDAALELELNPELKKIFIVTSLRCPVCGIDDDHIYVSNSAYSVKYDLIDLMPKYKWLNPEFESYNIAAFNVWQCQNCGYTAIREYYEDPVQDTALTPTLFKHAVEHFFKEDTNAARVISFLKEKKGINNTTLAMELKRLLIAVYILENIGKIKNEDSVSLGRTYIRLSWALREFETLPANEKEKVRLELNDTFKAFSEIWSDCPTSEAAAIEKSITYYEDAIYESLIMEEKESEHNIQQIIGLLYFKMGDKKKSRQFLHEASRSASKLKTRIVSEIQKLEKLHKHPALSDVPDQIAALKKKTSKLDNFLMDVYSDRKSVV